MKNSVRLCLTVVLCVGFLLTCAAGVRAETRPYIVGVVPQQSPATLAEQWGPLLACLNAASRRNFIFETASGIPEFEQRLAQGRYDFAYMNPYHYVVFHAKPGYVALAHEKGVRIQGILVVPQSSPVHSLEQLAGKKVAFPAPAAFAATILPLAYLRKQGIEVQPEYVSSHDSVYLAVASGYFAAGGGIERTLRGVSPALRDSLRVLWRTPLYTPHAIAAHPRVPESVREDFLNALVALSQSPEGRAALARANFQGFEPASDREWNDIRGLGLTTPGLSR